MAQTRRKQGLDVSEFTVRQQAEQRFSSPEKARRHVKVQLAASMRTFAELGFGHSAPWMSARDPEFSEIFWMNPWERPLKSMKASDLIAIDSFTGKLVEGNGVVNPPAIRDISEIHRARKDVVSVAHSHALHGRIWSCVNRLLEPLSVDSCIFYGDHGLHREGDRRRSLGDALGDGRALILLNHGVLTVGRSVEENLFLMSKLERACEVQVQARLMGLSCSKLGKDRIEMYRSTIWKDAALHWGGRAMIELLLEEQPATAR